MSKENMCPTDFAPAEKVSSEEITAEVAAVAANPLLNLLIDSLPDILLILNQCRQVIFANRKALEILDEPVPEKLYGLRAGELFGCANVENSPGGCGTSDHCKFCGAVNATLNSTNGVNDVRECQMSRVDGTCLDLRIWASPINISGKGYIIFIARDISGEKRRAVLERIFFHDILNTAGGIKGISEILRTTNREQLDEMLFMIESASSTLVEEIRAQKDLLAAENGELKIKPDEHYVRQILTEVMAVYEKHEVAVERNIVIANDSEDFIIRSDSRLLKRIVENMTKNALEASAPDETVTLSVKRNGDMTCFSVWNSAFMPDDVQKQIFKRSFSTKGSGRGIGTWSIKLFTETYLQGRASFRSTPEEGTIFFAEVPDIKV
ncbi:MAG: hypothetical protein A2020_13450 [Lentisphaerae bacterium GWF2_45_14]|nr:MAG: hypothetical protein A2020_13450 [Lentisphaerae bacterium GWF2_45_14]